MASEAAPEYCHKMLPCRDRHLYARQQYERFLSLPRSTFFPTSLFARAHRNVVLAQVVTQHVLRIDFPGELTGVRGEESGEAVHYHLFQDGQRRLRGGRGWGGILMAVNGASVVEPLTSHPYIAGTEQ